MTTKAQRIGVAILAVITFYFASCSKGPETKLNGEWGATVEGTRIGIIFESDNRMTAIEGTSFFKGRYKADFSKTPAVLEFYDDRHPKEARYSFIELAGDNTLRTTLASSQMPTEWKPERTMILERKQSAK